MMYIDLGFCFLPSQAQLATSAESLDTIPAGVSIQEWNDAAQLICIRICFRISNIFLEGILYIEWCLGLITYSQATHFPASQARQLRKNWRKLASRSWGPARQVPRALVRLVQSDSPYIFVLHWGFTLIRQQSIYSCNVGPHSYKYHTPYNYWSHKPTLLSWGGHIVLNLRWYDSH